MIDYDKLGAGAGAAGVIVLNDWLCDTSTWDGARAYLDTERFAWVFGDLRGYGRSMERAGAFTLEEAVGDVLDVADALGWARFSVVGHSMSTLVALHLAQHHAERLERAVVLTPAPPAGLGADDATLAWLRAGALGDDAFRLAALRASWGERLSDGWKAFKVARWRAAAKPEAVAAYALMFAQRGLPSPGAKIAIPLLAVTGEQDSPVMRRDAVTRLLSPICDRLEVRSIADCGHYPMQEAPPLLVAIVERFLAGHTAPA